MTIMTVNILCPINISSARSIRMDTPKIKAIAKINCWGNH